MVQTFAHRVLSVATIAVIHTVAVLIFLVRAPDVVALWHVIALDTGRRCCIRSVCLTSRRAPSGGKQKVAVVAREGGVGTGVLTAASNNCAVLWLGRNVAAHAYSVHNKPG